MRIVSCIGILWVEVHIVSCIDAYQQVIDYYCGGAYCRLYWCILEGCIDAYTVSCIEVHIVSCIDAYCELYWCILWVVLIPLWVVLMHTVSCIDTYCDLYWCTLSCIDTQPMSYLLMRRMSCIDAYYWVVLMHIVELYTLWSCNEVTYWQVVLMHRLWYIVSCDTHAGCDAHCELYWCTL
jgi:hypothetical protein